MNHGISAAALHHARAFLTANGDAPAQRDFQVIFPAILIALQSPDKSVREAAKGLIECLAGLETRTLSASGEVGTYAFDAVYRESGTYSFGYP